MKAAVQRQLASLLFDGVDVLVVEFHGGAWRQKRYLAPNNFGGGNSTEFASESPPAVTAINRTESEGLFDRSAGNHTRGQRVVDNIREVYEALSAVDNLGGAREQIVDTLKQLGEKAAKHQRK